NEIKEIGLMVYHGSLFGLVEPDDKYKGIKKMVEFLGGQEEDIIVFGDGMNDIKMFEKAAFSVAMGNAEEELKKLASYITDDADSDGIYNACRHLQLID
ncbi:MAG: HAD hydrolase family protein, partial [Anaerorhabdus sp.]